MITEKNHPELENDAVEEGNPLDVDLAGEAEAAIEALRYEANTSIVTFPLVKEKEEAFLNAAVETPNDIGILRTPITSNVASKQDSTTLFKI